MSRLIVSGCSFTKYNYPTWAWFLASGFDQTFNYGATGAGNEYIYHSIIDADTDLTLTAGDTVVIAWSGCARYDTFDELSPGRIEWKTRGSWAWNPDIRQLEKFVHVDGWVRKSVNYMIATARYLESKNITYLFTSLEDLSQESHTADDYVRRLLKDLLAGNFIFPAGLVNEVTTKRESNNVLLDDGHPTVGEHYVLAQKIAARLNCKFSTLSIPVYEQAALRLSPDVQNAMIDSGTLIDLNRNIPQSIVAQREQYSPDCVDAYLRLLGAHRLSSCI